MSALARQHITGSLARAANDDRINGGSCNRTKYTYDANGNVLTRPGYSTMTWSSYNYPTSISTGYGPGWTTSETVGFAYGPNRQRWQQTYSGNNTTETTDYIGGVSSLYPAVESSTTATISVLGMRWLRSIHARVLV